MSEQDFYEQGGLWRAERWLQGAQLQRLTQCVNMLPAGWRSLLDVGAGNGAFLSLVEKCAPAGAVMTGIERAATAIEARVCSSPLLRGNADALSQADRSFDVVSALELIEHLPWGVYENTLAELARVADRHVLINVPYREHRLQAQCPYCGCRFSPYFHMRSFDEARLDNLLPGFRRVTSKGISSLESVLRVATLPFRTRVYGGFPPTAICPQCSYHDSDQITTSVPSHSAFSKSVRSLTDRLPKKRVTTEIIVLYQRLT